MLKKCERVNKLKLKLNSNSSYFLPLRYTLIPLCILYSPYTYYAYTVLCILPSTLYYPSIYLPYTTYYTNLILPYTIYHLLYSLGLYSSLPSFILYTLTTRSIPSYSYTLPSYPYPYNPLNTPFLYTYYKTLNFSLTTL